jgi:YidC/Oxa1 family membrane protein insertase
MKFDRNTVWGFLVLGLLFVGYFWFTSRDQAAYRKQKATQDSIANANKPKVDTALQRKETARLDSASKSESAGNFKKALNDSERTTVVENSVLRISFSTKGGQPRKVELKKYKSADSTLVRLASTDFDKIDYAVNTSDKASTTISNLNFRLDTVQTNADSSQLIVYTLADSSGTAIHHNFLLKKDDYMVDFTVQLDGADKLLTQGNFNLNWSYKAVQQEANLSFEKINTQVGYVVDGDYDYHTIGKTSNQEFSKPVKWIGIRQRFFNTILVSKNNFSSGRIDWTLPADSAKTVMQSTAVMNVKLPIAREATIPLSILYGPADYHILTKYDLGFGKLINLGQGPYTFVRPVNKYIILPIFDFIKSFISSYGLVIALLTIFIRLVISPLSYTSYLSSAKMKVLRPEIAKLKEKYGSDQQQISVEQMKLFREAGVNPLGGCIPALLQIPIFFALYSFFNSNVALRGQPFLWATDLSAPDKVISFATKIPILGWDHISMFTITAVATSFLISLYSMSMSPDQSNPVMKYMPYIFPVFLLFIFNSLPSALTWYYTVSNLITLVLQFVIQNYIIDHDKILTKIEANRKKPKTKSKWQERMAQMQEQQKRVKDSQQKNRR